MMLGDLIPYTCSVCRAVTYAPPRLIAVTCHRCNRIDLGTEIARQQWRTVAEIVSDTPTPIMPVRSASGAAAKWIALTVLGLSLAVIAGSLLGAVLR